MTEKDKAPIGADEKTKKIENPEVDNKTEAKTTETGPSRSELMRELSKEYGINLFDADGIRQFKEYQDSQKTELEKIREELEQARIREVEAKEALEKQKLNLLKTQYGIADEKFNDFLAIATAKTNDQVSIEDAFKQTVEEYGTLFVAEKQKDNIKLGVEVQTDSRNQEVKTFEEQVLEAYLNRRK